MGGYDDDYSRSFWRRLVDGFRFFGDTHQLLVVLALLMGGALMAVMLMGSVFGAVVWSRQGELERRIDRVEAYIWQSRGEMDDSVAF